MPYRAIPMGDGALNCALREPYSVVARVNALNEPVAFGVMTHAPVRMIRNGIIMNPANQEPLAVLELAGLLGDLLPGGLFDVLIGASALVTRLCLTLSCPSLALSGASVPDKLRCGQPPMS